MMSSVVTVSDLQSEEEAMLQQQQLQLQGRGLLQDAACKHNKCFEDEKLKLVLDKCQSPIEYCCIAVSDSSI